MAKMADLNINIWLDDLNKFIKVFLQTPDEVVKEYHMLLTIHVPCIVEGWVDLIPLARLALRAPDLQVVFASKFQHLSRVEALNHTFETARVAITHQPPPESRKNYSMMRGLQVRFPETKQEENEKRWPTTHAFCIPF